MRHNDIEVKSIGKLHLYSDTLEAYAASKSLCVTDKGGMQPRPQPKPEITDKLRSAATCWSPPCKYMDYYSFTDPEGTEG